MTVCILLIMNLAKHLTNHFQRANDTSFVILHQISLLRHQNKQCIFPVLGNTLDIPDINKQLYIPDTPASHCCQMHTHAHSNAHAHTDTLTHIPTDVRTHEHMHTHIHTSACTYVHIYVHTHAHTHAHIIIICVRTHTNTHIHLE